MEIVSKKNTLLVLAAITLILLIYMGFSVYQRYNKLTPAEKEMAQIKTQSESTEIEAIEKDLLETDLSDVDKELQDIENELNSIY